MSNKKANECLDSLRAGQAMDDFARERQWLLKEVTGDPSLLQLCRAVILKHQKSKAQASVLKRGVTCLGNCPTYVVRMVLKQLSGLDMSVFTRLTQEECRRLFYFGLKGEKGMRLPRREMSTEAFLAWAAERHNKVGRPLAGLECDGSVDWENGIGVFRFVASASEDVVSMVEERATGVSVRLPEGYRNIQKALIGVEWFIRHNYSKKTAQVTNEKLGLSQSLAKLFGTTDEAAE